MSDDLVSCLRRYASNPISGSEYVPLHQSTVRQVADRIEALECVLSAVDVLLAAKGRYNSSVAYDRLSEIRRAVPDKP